MSLSTPFYFVALSGSLLINTAADKAANICRVVALHSIGDVLPNPALNSPNRSQYFGHQNPNPLL